MTLACSRLIWLLSLAFVVLVPGLRRGPAVAAPPPDWPSRDVRVGSLPAAGRPPAPGHAHVEHPLMPDKRPRIPLEKLLKFLYADLGPEQFYEQIYMAIKDHARKQAPDLKVDDYHDSYGTRGQLRQAMKDSANVDFVGLALVLRAIQMPHELLFDLDFRLPPWDTWLRGETVLFVVGSKHMEALRLNTPVRQVVVGGRDTQAMAHIIHRLAAELKIAAAVEVAMVHPGLKTDEARALLAELLGRPGLGCVFFLGSPRVNGLVDEVARQILNRPPSCRQSPLQFLWKEWPSRGPSFLSDSRSHDVGEEGIRLNVDGKTFQLPRDNDAKVVENAAAGNMGPWADCGIVLLDASGRNGGPRGPILCVCAGHGGAGTLGSVYSLLRQVDIARQLRLSTTGRLFPGPHKVCQLVRVQRRKQTPSNLDDCVVEPAFRKGFDIHWPPPAYLASLEKLL